MTRRGLDLQVRSAIADKLGEKGIELYDLEYRREHNGQILRIFIDTPHGVDTDTCVLATRAVKEFIDNLADLDYDYLEVSSPGIDRILKQERDLIRFIGEKVLVKTSQPVEGSKKLVGILIAADPNTLSIEIEGQLVHLKRELIMIVRLHPDI